MLLDQKKILFVNSLCSSGSTGNIVYELYTRAKENGYKCAVAYGRGDSGRIPKEDSYKIGTPLSLYRTVLLARFFDIEGFSLVAQTKRFLSFVDSFSPDIVHLHNVHGYFLNLELLMKYFSSHKEIKVVWTLHDMWTMTGRCAIVDEGVCDKWIEGCNHCSRKDIYPKTALLDKCKKNYIKKKKLISSVENMTLVTPSEWLMSNVKRSYLKDKNKKVINNGIDLTLFKPTVSDLRKKYSLEGKTVVLGVSFKWVDEKGLSDFIRLRELLPEDFSIVLIGVSKKVKKILPDGIVAIERTESREELAAWYTASDYFLNLTYYDTFPTVNLEALACGTPVITYKTGGSPESLTDKCGLSSEKGNIDLIAKILKEKPVFSSSDCIERSKLYDKNNAVKGYLELYGC